MPVPQLKALAKKSGVPLKKIEKDHYPKAKKIAKDMGMEDNYAYIYGILENMLGIKESTVHKEIANGFLKSDKTSLKEYLNSLYEEITSSDIAVTPEKAPKKKKCDEEDEEEVEENCGKDHKKEKK